METIHADDSPLAAYLQGEGSFEPDPEQDTASPDHADVDDGQTHPPHSFAPPSKLTPRPRLKVPQLEPLSIKPPPQSAITRAHHAWSTAWNSRLGRADNARFMEHFRYIIVASQLLNEYLDHGSLTQSPTPCLGLDGADDDSSNPRFSASLYGAVATGVVALALAYLIQWSRNRRSTFWTKSRVTLALTVLAVVAFVGYQYGRRQWLKSLRRQAVDAASSLTTNWQAFELSSSSALGFIQEVELVSKGYRLSTPLPPVSRLEESGTSRRCAKLRKSLHTAFSSNIPACIEACTTLRALIEDDDLEKYFEVYDISTQDAKEAAASEALSAIEDDMESLRALRVLSYRSGILRRVTLCSLMALEADGGKPDMGRWEVATKTMRSLNQVITASAERIRKLLNDMENINLPSPVRNNHTPSREKMRSQVRKISALSSGIRGLQVKMQILREETNHSIEQSDDLTDLGPSLMAQYDSIGSDLKELMQAWEVGKQSLQSNIKHQEHRISMASSGLRSPVSSIGGLTAVEEDGSPADALRSLNGLEPSKSNRSSTGTAASDEEIVFEAIALPRQRQRAASTLTREERIVKMHEERERQAQMRAKRDANTSMMRELESVINLRGPTKKVSGNGNGTMAGARITSL